VENLITEKGVGALPISYQLYTHHSILQIRSLGRLSTPLLKKDKASMLIFSTSAGMLAGIEQACYLSTDPAVFALACELVWMKPQLFHSTYPLFSTVINIGLMLLQYLYS
jgi:hypothetical protein